LKITERYKVVVEKLFIVTRIQWTLEIMLKKIKHCGYHPLKCVFVKKRKEKRLF